MSKHLKIKTALFIALAFIMRLVILNIDAITPTRAGNQLAGHLSTLQKRRDASFPGVGSSLSQQSTVEAAREVLAVEDDSVKFKIVLLSIVLFIFLPGISNMLKSKDVFDFNTYNLYPRRYLSISVLRI